MTAVPHGERVMLEAALEKLRSFNDALTNACQRRDAELATILALLPDCPTCCGTLYVNHPAFPNGGAPCPDCVDGRVPLERLANLFTAVHDPMYHTCCLKDVPATWAGAFSHLRAIR